MRTNLPMIDVQKSQTANYGRSKQSNFKYTIMVLLWNYCEYQRILVTEIVSSQRIIYMNIHKYSTQSKLISVVVIL